WAGTGDQFPVQPENRHNHDIRNEAVSHVRGVLRPHRDGDEMLLGSQLQLTPGAPACDRSLTNKGSHERRLVGNTPGKRLDHARQLGSTDRPPAANSLSYFQ